MKEILDEMFVATTICIRGKDLILGQLLFDMTREKFGDDFTTVLDLITYPSEDIPRVVKQYRFRRLLLYLGEGRTWEERELN